MNITIKLDETTRKVVEIIIEKENSTYIYKDKKAVQLARLFFYNPKRFKYYIDKL